LSQRVVDLEVIVVDEASTDATPAILRAAAGADPRVRVIRHESPQGVATARNRGAAEASCEWIAFLDDDDLWAPDKLTLQVTAALESGCNWAYTGAVSITETGRILHGEPPPPPDAMVSTIRHYNAVPGGGSNVVLRRSTLGQIGPFDTRLHNTEDWEMWIRLAKAGPPAWVCRPLMAYRVHESNSSLNIPEILRGTRLIEQMHDTTADWGRLHRWLAESCLRTGRRGAALAEFGKAAVRGQAGGVASDLSGIIRRRVARYAGGSSEKTILSSTWVREAASWLSAFEDGPPCPRS
jgi:glycosyltransferase involved in cell wall biosynthesis